VLHYRAEYTGGFLYYWFSNVSVLLKYTGILSWWFQTGKASIDNAKHRIESTVEGSQYLGTFVAAGRIVSVCGTSARGFGIISTLDLLINFWYIVCIACLLDAKCLATGQDKPWTHFTVIRRTQLELKVETVLWPWRFSSELSLFSRMECFYILWLSCYVIKYLSPIMFLSLYQYLWNTYDVHAVTVCIHCFSCSLCVCSMLISSIFHKLAYLYYNTFNFVTTIACYIAVQQALVRAHWQ